MNLIFSAQRAWDCLILQQVMDESYFSCHGIKSQWQVGICDILSWVGHLWHLWTESMMANLRHTSNKTVCVQGLMYFVCIDCIVSE